MPNEKPPIDIRRATRGPFWKWWICGLLLLATMINYIDRLTLNLMAKPIMEAFHLDDRNYGQLESAFGSAFALGAIVMGFLADRWNIRGLYPAAVILWSLAGFATGLVNGFAALLVCRFLLGLAEAGNWPCALRTTQRILAAEERTLGNSILQSGAAIGAILTPLLVLGLLRATGSWRYPFMAVGGLGLLWAVLWLISVRREDLELTCRHTSSSLISILSVLVLLFIADSAVHYLVTPQLGESIGSFDLTWVPLLSKIVSTAVGIVCVFFWLSRATRDEGRPAPGEPALVPRNVFIRRFWVLAVVVVAINATWHYFRAWLPLFLQNQHGYSIEETGWFSMGYYVFTDIGSLTAGFGVLLLVRLGFSVHGSRMLVFGICAAITLLSMVAAVLPAGPLLLGVLLLIGFAALGVFPNYYSFTQELTVQHQGKLTGALGCICWLAMALVHELAGDSSMRTGSYSQGVAIAGLFPLVGLAALLLFWGRTPTAREESIEVGGEDPTKPPTQKAFSGPGDSVRLSPFDARK